MASWKSTTEQCGKNIHRVDAVWNDGQESYVKKFNNGIPTYIHSKEFYRESMFFLHLSGKNKEILSSVYLELGEEVGKIKLINASPQYAALFTKHWTLAGLEGLSLEANNGIKEPRPTRATLRAVMVAFETCAAKLSKDRVDVIAKEVEKLNGSLFLHFQKLKPKTRKPVYMRKFGIDNNKAQKMKARRDADRALSAKTRTPTKSIDINKHINNLSRGSMIKASNAKGTIIDLKSHFTLSFSSDINCGDEFLATIDLPFKTYGAALKALNFIDGMKEKPATKSPFTLYLMKNRTLGVAVTGTQPERDYYKVIQGVDELMDIFTEDWGGTALGYALQKTFNKKLGKFINNNSSGEILNPLLKLNTRLANGYNHTQGSS